MRDVEALLRERIQKAGHLMRLKRIRSRDIVVNGDPRRTLICLGNLSGAGPILALTQNLFHVDPASGLLLNHSENSYNNEFLRFRLGRSTSSVSMYPI